MNCAVAGGPTATATDRLFVLGLFYRITKRRRRRPTDRLDSFLLSFFLEFDSERCLPFSFVRNGHAQTSNRSGGGALKFEIENTQNGFVRLHLFNRLLC